MIKPILSLALTALLIAPSLAQAEIIKIEYTGYVSSIEGTGLGYAPGDSIQGAITIDFSKSAGFNVISETARSYYALGTEHYLITGFHAENRGNSADFLELYDTAYAHNGAQEDFLKVSDSDSEFMLNPDFSFVSKFYSFYLELLLPGIDWLNINDLSATNYSTSDASQLLASRAQMYNVFATGIAGSETVVADVAHIRFNALSINAVNVPETNSALLFLLALTGLFFRFKSALITSAKGACHFR